MRINQLIFILFSTLFLFKANAQEFKLGKVSIEELQQKVHPKDTSAVAAILFKKGETRFEYSQERGFEMVTVVKTRIKIYKKKGYDWSNQSMQYFLGSNLKEEVSFLNAITFNLVEGKIEKTKLKSDGEFDEKINKYWGIKKITMPNVKEGSVIEYEYTIRTPRISELKEWFFQSSIPVNYSEFITDIPEYFVYNPNSKGYLFPKVTIEKNQKSIIINNKERSGGRGFSTTKTTFSQDKIDYQETKTTYLAENLPAMREEAFVNNVDNYTASVSHELAMTKFPNSTMEMYSTNWESVTNKIYENEDFGIELKKTGYFEEDIDALTKSLNTPEEKVAAIFTYVKSSVKWNNYYGYSCNDGVKKAYKDKTGNIAEINLMLTAMLRYTGLTANPVLVSTRSNGIAMFPNRTAFNYVIAGVETPNGLILLDASDKFSTPNVLPFRALNWVGRLIRKDGTSEEVDLMPKIASNDIVTMNYAIDAKGGVSGKLRRQRTGHNAMVFRKNIDDIKEETYLEKLENDNDKIEIKEYSRTNEKELKLPVTETFSYAGSNFCEIVGGKIYVNPMLFFLDNENPFKQENREYPIDYGYPFMDKYAINIQIPDGYKVENLPATTILSMMDNLGSFKFMTSLAGSTVQMSVTYQINEPIISSSNYSMLKDFYQKMIEKKNEKIILVKI
jgi:transglutaminase-like putative cysteine protease